MPNSKPDAAILLQGAVAYLEDELLPSLEGYHRFQTRVAINVLKTVRRELELSASQAAAETARLAALAGHRGPREQLNSELCTRIRAGSLSSDDPALRAHIRRSLEEALAINNPKWR